MKRNQVRIIGGKWRGRKISFPESELLRPTPDRVKETLFNWLAPALVGARCLDVFAGSGGLGFEALSRNADFLTLLEQNPLSIDSLQKNAVQLDVPRASFEIIHTESLAWLHGKGTPYDIVFVDPPYQSNLLMNCFVLLEQQGWLRPNALIYFESNQPFELEHLPQSWEILRQKKAGQVYYYLAKKG